MRKLMILVIIVLLSFVNNLSIYAIEQEKESPKEFVSKYEVNSPNWTDDEYEKYYIENKIFPMSTFGNAMMESALETYLKGKYSSTDFSKWQAKTDTIANVMSVYHGNEIYNPVTSRPKNIVESNVLIQNAKESAYIERDYIGCGPLAMIGQFDFLARYAGYYSIMPEPDSDSGQINMAKEILRNTSALSSTIGEVNLYELFPFIAQGTFTFPDEVISSSNELLESYGLSVSATRTNANGNIETYYTDESQIVVSGDKIPSLLSINDKVNNMKNSIDDGMPVIVWTAGGDNSFTGHYFNVFGYEYWDDSTTPTDENHLVFKVNFNWPESKEAVIYIPYEYFAEWNCGFIYFEENHDKALLYATDVPPVNTSTESNLSLTSSVGGYTFNAKVKRFMHILRCVYMNLSANQPSKGESYIEYTSPRVIDKIYFCANWVSETEKNKTSIAKVQYQNSSGTWIDAHDILTHPYVSDNELFGIWCDFPTYTYKIRIYLSSTDATGTINPGGLKLYNINFFFTDHVNHSYTNQYFAYSDTYHYGYCVCGKSSLMPHVFITSGTKQKCKLCNYVLQSGGGLIGPMSNRILHSANGSYVLANGVVFLVDEDIDAYFNGTLVFFNSNNQLVMQ